MKILNFIFLFLFGCFAIQVTAQKTLFRDRCGIGLLHRDMALQNPAWQQRWEMQRRAVGQNARWYLENRYSSTGNRQTNTTAPIPVIFHFILDSAQYLAVGGLGGITQRCDSQIAVLNADYNRGNADSQKIPLAWKDSLYGNSGIRFALARVDPYGNCTPGFEIKIIAGSSLSDAGYSNYSQRFPEAKTEGSGLASWNVTEYYNVWCFNFNGAANGILGITASLSDTGTCWTCYPVSQIGACILYSTVGSTGSTNLPPTGTGTWDLEYARGRTLTHETGHFLEIWHPWGDDNGQCPTWSSSFTITGSGLSASIDGGITCTPGIGWDDGLADTPPESDAVFGSPEYTIAGGTTRDCCEYCSATLTQPIGIACLSFMDYTDDTAMHLFTPQQAAAMAAMVLAPPTGATGATGTGHIGENYGLTQHPELLVCPSEVKSTVPSVYETQVFPNPATDVLYVITPLPASLLLTNMEGQLVAQYHTLPAGEIQIPLYALPAGWYFVQIRTVNGVSIFKILRRL